MEMDDIMKEAKKVRKLYKFSSIVGVTCTMGGVPFMAPVATWIAKKIIWHEPKQVEHKHTHHKVDKDGVVSMYDDEFKVMN